MSLRTHSFVWGGLACAASVGLGLGLAINSQNWSNFIYFVIAGVLLFTMLSCVILCNNFVGSMIATVFSWGFVRMPGVIFELDLDGILWLLTVKLIFWILGLILAVLAGALAIALGLALIKYVIILITKAKFFI